MLIFVAILLGHAMSFASACTCTTIGSLSYIRPRAGFAENAAGATDATDAANATNATDATSNRVAPADGSVSFVLTSDPGMNATRGVEFTNEITATLVCDCTTVPSTLNYIVSAVQARPDADGPTSCIGQETMQSACTFTGRAGLMECQTVWSSGASGVANKAGVESGALIQMFRNVVRGQSLRSCTQTIDFQGAEDSILIGPS